MQGARLACGLVLLVPALGVAQGHVRDTAGAPPITRMAPAPATLAAPPSSVAPPPTSIGLPLAPLGLPPAGSTFAPSSVPGAGDALRARLAIPVWPGAPGNGVPAPQRALRRRATGVFLYPAVPWSPWVASAVPTAPATRRAPVETGALDTPRGWLHLDVDAAAWPDVYLDGYFVGRLDEVPRPLELAAGPHSLRLSADGFEDLRVDVRVAADRTITYRGALHRVATADARPATAPHEATTVAEAPRTAPPTFYVIPGCYVGNVQPTALELPAGCDLDRLRVLSPR